MKEQEMKSDIMWQHLFCASDWLWHSSFEIEDGVRGELCTFERYVHLNYFVLAIGCGAESFEIKDGVRGEVCTFESAARGSEFENVKS